jgi:hypothetical protein
MERLDYLKYKVYKNGAVERFVEEYVLQGRTLCREGCFVAENVL